LGLCHIALVESAEVREQFSSLGDVLVGAQHGAGKTTALHLAELIDQHIAGGAYLACEPATAAQHQGLAESATIGEFREMQFNGLNVLQRLLQGVCVIG